jgi:3-hydroxybutyryl-CoA dehydrogenase
VQASETTYKRPAVVGSGTIACGLAATATLLGEVTVLARSDASAWRAEEKSAAACSKLEGADASKVRVTTDPSQIADCDLVVEAVVEDMAVKTRVLTELADQAPEADLATTTSSLSITELGQAIGHPVRFFGLHVFNPVVRMQLIEVCFPDACREGLRERALAWCASVGKTAVEVPDQAGFVVNRLLFPYLFDAVRLLERTGMEPGKVDACMTLGAGLPMGPLALLDFVGLDVAQAIGDTLYADSSDPAHQAPGLLVEKVGEGKLGRKSGEGFYTYD